MDNKANPLKLLRRQSLNNGNDVIYIKKSIRFRPLSIRSEGCMKFSRVVFEKSRVQIYKKKKPDKEK